MDRADTGMQILSNIPPTLPKLIETNTFASTLIPLHPSRFGFLIALPTDNGPAALNEAKRGLDDLGADAIAVTACYNGYWLSNPDLNDLWEELDKRGETVHIHPNAYDKGSMGRPAPLIDVAFESAKGVVEMLYCYILACWRDTQISNGSCKHTHSYRHRDDLLKKSPSGHCGGAFPALSGRLALLGTQSWVPNSNPNLTAKSIPKILSKLYVDCAATATPHTLYPAVEVVGAGHIVYGSDCGVQCSTEETMGRNKRWLMEFEGMTHTEREEVGRRGWIMFPRALERWRRVQKGNEVKED
jgi:hypothetical protein